MMNSVPRKKGKPPKIDSIPNLKAEVVGKEAVYYLNMEKYPVTAVNGQTISPFRKNSKAVDASFETNGPIAKISFSVPLGRHKKFNRAMYKIAFSSLAFFCGVDEALDSKYDHIRDYVLHGGKCSPVLFLRQEKEEYRHEVLLPCKSEHSDFHFVYMVIAGIGFIVDLSPDQAGLVQLKAMLEQNSEYEGWWGLIPPQKTVK